MFLDLNQPKQAHAFQLSAASGVAPGQHHQPRRQWRRRLGCFAFPARRTPTSIAFVSTPANSCARSMHSSTASGARCGCKKQSGVCHRLLSARFDQFGPTPFHP